MHKKQLFIGISVLVSLLLVGCQLAFESEKELQAESAGAILVSISAKNAEDINVRSVLPKVTITAYELWGDSGTGNRKLADFTTITNASVSLSPGIWDFSLKAFEEGVLIMQGNLADKIISSSSHSLAFILTLDNIGTGSIDITISFPATAGIVSASAVMGAETESLAISNDRTSITYAKRSVPAGNRFISFQLRDANDALIGIVSELVLVRNNRVSEADIILTAEDLRFTSMMPTDIVAVLQDNNSIQLTWNPVASAARYNIYRADSSGEYVLMGERIDTSYNDANVLLSTAYTYKVSSVNNNNVESLQSIASSSVTPTLGIQSFAFLYPEATGTISGNTIAITVPSIVNLTELTPDINHNGLSISPALGVPQDFSNPVTYTITDPDSTTRAYTVTVTVINYSLNSALSWIGSNSKEGASYAIVLNQNETVAPQTLSYSEKRVTITLRGKETERIVSLNANGSLFAIGSQVTFILDDNVTLDGKTGNSNSVISVQSEGTFIMKGGSISGNTASSLGGGVYIAGSGTFTMQGGAISGNTSSLGGGVYIAGSGTFTMEGGVISGNTASSSGGGVYNSGTFTKRGGIIYGSDVPIETPALKNTAGGQGQAVHAGNKVRNTTADELVSLDSGMDGGFEVLSPSHADAVLLPINTEQTLTLAANRSPLYYFLADTAGSYTVVLYDRDNPGTVGGTYVDCKWTVYRDDGTQTFWESTDNVLNSGGSARTITVSSPGYIIIGVTPYARDGSGRFGLKYSKVGN
jgi:hypothetical protein